MIYTSFNRIIQLEYNDNKLKKRNVFLQFCSVLLIYTCTVMYNYVHSIEIFCL